MHLNETELAIVQDVLRQYAAGYEVWAFGSRVTGKRLKDFSDLDLVILTDEELTGRIMMQIKDAFSLSMLKFRVDVLDWASVSEDFRKIIMQNYEVVQTRPPLWDKIFTRISDLESQEILSGLHARMVHTAHCTIVFWRIEQGAILPEHQHHHEQTAIITKGSFELTVEGKTQEMREGDIAVIAPHKSHSGRAITDCELTDIFYPIRQDYLEGMASHA